MAKLRRSEDLHRHEFRYERILLACKMSVLLTSYYTSMKGTEDQKKQTATCWVKYKTPLQLPFWLRCYIWRWSVFASFPFVPNLSCKDGLNARAKRKPVICSQGHCGHCDRWWTLFFFFCPAVLELSLSFCVGRQGGSVTINFNVVTLGWKQRNCFESNGTALRCFAAIKMYLSHKTF